MRSLRDLLSTWENWAARDTLTRALGRVATEEGREALRRGLAEKPEIDPLDALRDAAELVGLLTGWQWQAVGAAREAGASWDRIGSAVGVEGEQVRLDYLAAAARQHALSSLDATPQDNERSTAE